MCIAFSAPLIALARTSAGSASFWRCAFAVPLLAALTALDRPSASAPRAGGPCWKPWRLAFAGAFLGTDMVLWNRSISEVGVGVSTVLANLAVVIVPVLARVLDKEALPRRYLPAVIPTLIGVVLAAGLGAHAFGSAPLSGAVHATASALCYVFFLRLLRQGAGTAGLNETLLVVTACAGLASLVLGLAWHGVAFTIGWHAAWLLLLLAVTGQVVGWLLITLAVASLPAAVSSTLLLVQPVGAVLLGYVLLDQHLPVAQLGGCALVLVSVIVVASSPRATRGMRRSQLVPSRHVPAGDGDAS